MAQIIRIERQDAVILTLMVEETDMVWPRVAAIAVSEMIGMHLYTLESGSEARVGIGQWISNYNVERSRSALDGSTPDDAYGISDEIGLAA